MRQVGCSLTFEVTQDAVLALQIAPAATTGELVEEQLRITVEGRPVAPPIPELGADRGGRIHVAAVTPGTVTIDYSATLAARRSLSPPRTGLASFGGLEGVVALRQSRYCASDALAGYAAAEFGSPTDATPTEIAQRVASWVFERLAYAPGSSGPLDTALDTLASGSGVCRDFAHLTITLCRALGVPARLVSVYAPGISPMDFHAVVEVLTADGWQVVDPTRLAPRRALVRIATGRDAADTAFATTLRGTAELVASWVFASSDGDLPPDDHAGPVPLP
jgi:transglutaminase-like putative cysteine protease